MLAVAEIAFDLIIVRHSGGCFVHTVRNSCIKSKVAELSLSASPSLTLTLVAYAYILAMIMT